MEPDFNPNAANVTTINIDQTLVPVTGAKIHIVRSNVEVIFEDVVIESDETVAGIRLILDKQTQAVLGRIKLDIQKQEAEANVRDETETEPYYGSNNAVPDPDQSVAAPIEFEDPIPENTNLTGITNTKLAERLKNKAQ